MEAPCAAERVGRAAGAQASARRRIVAEAAAWLSLRAGWSRVDEAAHEPTAGPQLEGGTLPGGGLGWAHVASALPAFLPPSSFLVFVLLEASQGFVTKPWEAKEEEERSALGLARLFPEGRASCDLSRAMPRTPPMQGRRGQSAAVAHWPVGGRAGYVLSGGS